MAAVPAALSAALSAARNVALTVAAVGAGIIVLLLRVAGHPAGHQAGHQAVHPVWDTLFAEDYGVFLVNALARPWHLLTPYNGYLQLGPRLIGQLVASFLPLADAAAAFTVAGALIASASALVIYHAIGGYVRSPWHRALAAAALLLLPIAPLEIADCLVNSPWYATTALFFAVLWRPRTRAGQAAAALVAFYAASSEIVAVIYAPLLFIRAIALPRWREHWVTLGWAAGLALQLPVVAESYAQHTQRVGRLASFGQALAFYLNHVVLRVPGWRISVHLVDQFGAAGATAIVGGLLAAGAVWALVTGTRQVRLFTVAALVTGFAQTIFVATINHYADTWHPKFLYLNAARYSTIPIVLIDVAAIVAVDSFARRGGMRALAAATVLACVLAVGWITDFRYVGHLVGTQTSWQPVAQSWLAACGHSPTGRIVIPAWDHTTVTVECSRLRR
jgi:hypothetical protein